jgi:hypothetical protein
MNYALNRSRAELAAPPRPIGLEARYSGLDAEGAIRIRTADGWFSCVVMRCARSMESCFHAMIRLTIETFLGRISESTSIAAGRFPFLVSAFCGSVLDARLFVAAPRNAAHVVGIDDAREMTDKLRQMMTVVLEEVSNLPERVMDEAAVAPLILNRSLSELR